MHLHDCDGKVKSKLIENEPDANVVEHREYIYEQRAHKTSPTRRIQKFEHLFMSHPEYSRESKRTSEDTILWLVYIA